MGWNAESGPAGLTDERLMDRVVQGDQYALGQLFERYKAPLFRFIYRMVGNQELAEDLLQDTFVRLYDKRRFYQRGRKFSTWIYTLAKNLTLDRCRAAERRNLSLDSLLDGESLEVPDPAPGPQAQFERAETARRVREALSTLRPADRSLVVLREYEGLSYAEIGQVLGIPEGAARTRAHRARQRLKELLQDLAPQ